MPPWVSPLAIWNRPVSRDGTGLYTPEPRARHSAGVTVWSRRCQVNEAGRSVSASGSNTVARSVGVAVDITGRAEPDAQPAPSVEGPVGTAGGRLNVTDSVALFRNRLE